MKKITFVHILLILGLTNCRQGNSAGSGQKSNVKPSFDFIEITFDKKEGGITSVYVDSTKILRVKHSDTNGVQYLLGQIPDYKLTELNQLASKAIDEKVDSIVMGPSEYFISYSLIFRQNGKTMRTFVYEDKDYPFHLLRDFTSCLFLLRHKVKENKNDTNFIFKTYQIICDPPTWTDDTVKFLSPIIKDKNASH
jgi:hypothetical protein